MIDKQNYFTYIDNTSDDTDKTMENLYKHKEIKEQYYKLEQECEFWKKELDRTHLLMLERQDELVKEILKNDQLKVENEELKKNIEICWENLKISEENKKIQHEHWFQRCSEIQGKANDFEQTLIEIKEIAKPYNDMSGNCVIVNCFEDMYKILEKISEVLNDR